MQNPRMANALFHSLPLLVFKINRTRSPQDDLHRDFELVQSMLEERQSEVERLQKELLEVPIRLQAEFDASVRKLQKRMNEKCDAVEERDEDLYMLNEEKVNFYSFWVLGTPTRLTGQFFSHVPSATTQLRFPVQK